MSALRLTFQFLNSRTRMCTELNGSRFAATALQNAGHHQSLYKAARVWVCSVSSQHFQAILSACSGISLLYTPHSAITHHLTPAFALTAPIALSLVSVATLVKPEWLTTLLSAGDSLEATFVLPSPTKFRPTFTASLPIALKAFSVWEPNEERAGLFKDKRFIFVGEKGREVQEAVKELVKRGRGQYECFAVQGGKLGLHNVLAKAKSKGKDVILVAEEDAMKAAIGTDEWMELEQEAAR